MRVELAKIRLVATQRTFVVEIGKHNDQTAVYRPQRVSDWDFDVVECNKR